MEFFCIIHLSKFGLKHHFISRDSDASRFPLNDFSAQSMFTRVDAPSSPGLVDVRALAGGAGRGRLGERSRVQDPLRSGVHRRLRGEETKLAHRYLFPHFSKAFRDKYAEASKSETGGSLGCKCRKKCSTKFKRSR